MSWLSRIPWLNKTGSIIRPSGLQSLARSTQLTMSTPITLHDSQLFQWMQSGEFWDKLAEFRTEILPAIRLEFGSELEHLKTAYADRRGVGSNARPFGLDLYPEEEAAGTYHELDRTLTAVKALLWIQNDKKDAFNDDLSDDDWTWVRQQFQTPEASVFSSEHAETCYALLTSVITNDIGKSTQIDEAYKAFTGSEVGISGQNHDAKLRSAVEAGMVPSYNRLPQDLQHDIMLGIEIAAECNLGQVAQAENVPASMCPLKRFCGNARAWRLRFMEHILDLAGAQGQVNNNKAIIFGPAIAQGVRSAHEAAEDVIFRGMRPKIAWTDNLVRKNHFITQSCGYKTQLTVDQPQDRALMRLHCLAGIGYAKPSLKADDPIKHDPAHLKHETSKLNREIAELYEETLLRSEETAAFRDQFIALLNEEGLARPAVQVTYLPAMCNGAVSLPWKTRREKVRALASVFEWATKAMHLEEPALEAYAKEQVTVVEVDAFDVTQFIKGSAAVPSRFFEDVSLLQQEEIPKAYISNRVEPGFASDFGRLDNKL